MLAGQISQAIKRHPVIGILIKVKVLHRKLVGFEPMMNLSHCHFPEMLTTAPDLILLCRTRLQGGTIPIPLQDRIWLSSGELSFWLNGMTASLGARQKLIQVISSQRCEDEGW